MLALTANTVMVETLGSDKRLLKLRENFPFLFWIKKKMICMKTQCLCVARNTFQASSV